MSPLIDCGKPLFFKLAGADQLDFGPPAARDGQGVRVAARSLSLMQKEALVASTRSGATWRLASDEGAYLQGDDVGPCPLAFFTTGMVASYMDAVLATARQRGIVIRDTRLIQDNFYSMEGSALRGTMTGGALPVDLVAEISSDADRETVDGLVTEAVAAAPISGLLRGAHESLFSLVHNGRPIETGRVRPTVGPAAADPAPLFDRARPAAGDWSGLIARAGMTPKTGEATSSTGSSYQEHQSRRLHVRGICTLRPDGIKAIEQHLYNPHGSIFHFLSEGGADDPGGGQGRAPDALSYIAAGIAFCFMTQLGRYASIAKKQLDAYRVVQNMHFSTGERSTADPVETHVLLDMPESAAFAQRVLDMGEQTCFLHALCRTDLEVRCSVRHVTGERASV